MRTKVLFRITIWALVASFALLWIGAFVLSSPTIVSGSSVVFTALLFALAVQYVV